MAFCTGKTGLIRRWFKGGLCAAGLLAGAVQAQATACEVDWRAGRLTVRADNATRASCLDAIAQRTGLSVSGLENVVGTVTLTLATAALVDAIRKLAGESSYTLVESDADHAGDPRTLSVRFVGMPTERSAKALQDTLRRSPPSQVRVENVDLGVMETQIPRASLGLGDPITRSGLPQTRDTGPRVDLED